MLKFATIILVAGILCAFAVDNLHRVELGLIVGRTVHVRLFFLLLTTFLVGCLADTIFRAFLSAQQGKKRRKTVREDADKDVEDDFFSS